MNYLLDTHALIWYLFDLDRLPDNLRRLITNEANVYASLVSIWEIAIKVKIGKLDIQYTPQEILALCHNESISILDITIHHIDATMSLPLLPYHRDPFDRLLIAQAKVEDMTLITCDRYIPQYSIRTLW